MHIITWQLSDFQGVRTQILQENKHSKEIQITMQKDSLMKEHKANFDITIQLLQGSVEFYLQGQSFTLKSLDMISVNAGIMHSLKALENSIIRLSLFKN